jgi:putative peptidoglycan lipid II flippase
LSKHLKNIGIVSFLTVVSRVLGLMRETLSAAIFGADVLNSAFITAWRLPNLFRRLLGEGSLNAAFLPTLQKELHEGGRDAAHRLLNNVASWLALVTALLVAGAMLAFSHSRLISGQEPKWYLAADLAVYLFPYLAFVCIAAAFNAVLNVYHHFTEPALSPIWLNLAMIGTLLAARFHFGRHPSVAEMHWLCFGILGGGFLQMAVPAAVLMYLGWRPRLDLSLSPRVREIAGLMGPGFFGTAIYQINIYVAGLIAFSLNDYASTLLFYANRLMELPIGVFAIAVSTVVYPLIARHAVERNFGAMAADYRKGLRLILVINVPAAVGLAILSRPIVQLLFQHGNFSAADTRLMSPLLALFVVGMPFFSVVNLTVRAFYSLHDTATPVRVASIDFVVNIGLCLTLTRWIGTAGLVLASTTAIIIQTVLLQRALARKLPEMTFAPLWPTVAKALGGAAVMAAVVGAGWLALDRAPLRAHPRDLLAVGGLIPVGVAVYAATVWALRIEGRDDVLALLRRFRRGGGMAAAAPAAD